MAYSSYLNRARGAVPTSVNPLDHRPLEAREGPDVAHAVPGVFLARPFALAFVALQKTRHEEFPGQRRQPHAPGPAVIDDARGLVRVDHFDHRARAGRIIDDGVII